MERKRRDLENSIKYQVLYYPGTDDTLESESYKQFRKGLFLTKELIKYFVSNYITVKTKISILYSPIDVTIDDLIILFPALLVTGEGDVLLDGNS